MARDPKGTDNGLPSPDRRHQEFQRDNAAWHRRVKERLARVEKAADDLRQAAARRPTRTGG